MSDPTTTIYYFTGTGNSLAVARNMANELGSCEMEPIAGFTGGGAVVPETPSVGLVCPLYFAGLPVIVAEFVKRLDLTNVEYVWAAITRKSILSGGALLQLSRLLREKGSGLDAGSYMSTVGNYVPKYDIPFKGLKLGLLADASVLATKAVEVIAARGKRLGWAPLEPLGPLLHKSFAETVNASDDGFTVLDSCTSCGICAQVCPVFNIRLVDGQPEWQHRCQRCLACLHWCPELSIQYGKKTEDRQRYHHPYVTLDDMREQKG
jgi:Pyruvate/2-oxoacid:ferredoxin oxidoreductase delta subunit